MLAHQTKVVKAVIIYGFYCGLEKHVRGMRILFRKYSLKSLALSSQVQVITLVYAIWCSPHLNPVIGVSYEAGRQQFERGS